MTALRLNDRQRLDALAALVLDSLTDYADEGTIESSPELANLYNAAAAVAERNGRPIAGYDRPAHADELLTAALAAAGADGALGQLWPSIRDSIGALA